MIPPQSLVLIIVSVTFQVKGTLIIKNYTDRMDVMSSSFSYHDYILDEKSGLIVYSFCDAFVSEPGHKYMSCRLTVKTLAFLASAFNRTCTADFSSEPEGLLQTLNMYYAHRHKVVLLNNDKVLLVKNSWSAGEPVKMELLIVRMSDCSIKDVNITTNLEPYLYPRKNVFDVIHFENEQGEPCFSSCYIRVTYDYEGKIVFGPVRYAFSDPIKDRSYTFWEPLHVGTPNEFSYAQTSKTDENGLTYHSIFKGGLNKSAELIIKTDNVIVGTSMLNGASSFCWLNGKSVISCKKYDRKGDLKLNISGNFFNNSVPWETKVTVRSEVQNPNLYKSKQLKVHNLQDGGLLLVTLNRICQITDNYLITQKEGFEVVKIDSSGVKRGRPLKIKIQDENFQNFKVFMGKNPRIAKNLYVPRVNVIESGEDVCFATWWDSSSSRRNKLNTTVHFSMKCLSKSYFENR